MFRFRKLASSRSPQQKYILSAVEDLSAGGFFQGAQNIEQGRFAGARTAHDGDPLPLADDKIEVPEKLDRIDSVPEYLCQPKVWTSMLCLTSFISQGFRGIEPGSLARRVKGRHQAYADCRKGNATKSKVSILTGRVEI